MIPAESEMIPFYKNKTILITGGSGFVGRGITIKTIVYNFNEIENIFKELN